MAQIGPERSFLKDPLTLVGVQGGLRPGLSLSGEGGALTAAWRERPWGWTVTRDMLGQLRASLRSPGEGCLSLRVPAAEHSWRQTGIHQGSDHTAPFSLGYAAALGAWKGWTQVSDLSYFLV